MEDSGWLQPVPAAQRGLPPVSIETQRTFGIDAPCLDTMNRSLVTCRSIVLGLALIPLNCVWVGTVEGVWHGLHFTCLSLAMNTVFILLALILLNQPLRRLTPAHALTQSELLTVFSMMALSSVLCGHDRMVTLMGIVAHATRYASPDNHWQKLFLDRLSPTVVIKDEKAAFYYYNGGSSFWSTGYWRFWVLPALSWTAFWGALVWALLCLNVLLRKRWMEHERLSYPIAQIPLAVTEQGSGFFQNRLMWLGFALAAGLETLNGINYLFPAVPGVTYAGAALEVGNVFTARPWNALGSVRLDWYPFMIGLGYLLPRDLIFSTWFFYILGKAQLVVGSAAGFGDNTSFPYQGMQAAGAVAVLGLTALWEARSYLWQVVRRAAGAASTVSDEGEGLSYRAAFAGLLLGMLVVCLFAWKLGMDLVVIPFYFLFFFLIALTVARLRAETGIPAHGLVMVNPQDVLITHVGTSSMSTGGVTALGLFQWFNRFNRAHPMPVGLEALRFSQVTGMERGRLLAALALTTVASLLSGFVIYPMLMYHHGASLAAELNWTGWSTYNNLASWLESPRAPDVTGSLFFTGGALFALALALLRARFVWWPLHPMGYALGVSGSVDRWWVALIIASVVKGLVVRYGGVRGYRAGIPFFMGIVLGQYVVACLWSLLAIAVNTPMYWSWTG